MTTWRLFEKPDRDPLLVAVEELHRRRLEAEVARYQQDERLGVLLSGGTCRIPPCPPPPPPMTLREALDAARWGRPVTT